MEKLIAISATDVTAPISGAKEYSQTAGQAKGAPITQRIATLDVLRGVALLGILTVHTGMIGSPDYILGYIPVDTGLLDKFAIRIVRHSAEAVLYLLFSFMFGVGLAMQVMRAAERAYPFAWLHIRRMAILFLIGVAHTVLLWDGDILKIYGVVGLVALIVPWIRPWMLLALAAATFLLMLLFLGGAQHIPINPLPAGSIVTQPAWVESAIDLYTNGTYAELVASRWNALGGILVGQIYLSIGVLFALFLGIYCGRVGLFEDVERHLSKFRWMLAFALIAGVLGNGLWVLSETSRDAMTYRLGFHISGAGMCFVYISGSTLFMRYTFGQKLLMPFAAVGKLSMTNYIMQTVIQVTLFYQLGLYGLYSRFTLLLLAFAIYALQVIASMWWVKQFHFGPLEWFWRTLTYAKIQPIFKSAA